MWLIGTSTVSGNLPFRLESGEYIVGRTKSAQIVIADATVSRRHARLIVDRKTLSIADLGSANGTRVNDQLTSQRELAVGDWVQFGSVLCALAKSPLLIRATDDEPTHQVHRTSPATKPIAGLTTTQQEVAELVAAGRTEAEIAVILDRSPHTIHTHLKAIFQRLGVHSRAELIVRVLTPD